MTEIDSANLVSLVAERSPLWDKTTKLYRDRGLVEKIWDEVAYELGEVSTDEVKKRWKGLRDTFGKELRKIPEGTFSDGGTVNFRKYTIWPYFESMLFLKNQMRPRKTGGNLPPNNGNHNQDDIHYDQQEDTVQETATGTIGEPTGDHVNNSEAIKIPKNSSQKSAKRNSHLKLIEFQARKLKILETKLKNYSAHSDDEDEYFFKSLLPHVRKLEPEEKLEFRMEVQSLVQNYVYKKKGISEAAHTVFIHQDTPSPHLQDYEIKQEDQYSN